MADPQPIDDPWEPHWLDPEPGAAPIDGSGIAALFKGVHPDDRIPHDTQIPLVPGIGIPDHLFEQAASSPQQTAPIDFSQEQADQVGAGPPPIEFSQDEADKVGAPTEPAPTGTLPSTPLQAQAEQPHPFLTSTLKAAEAVAPTQEQALEKLATEHPDQYAAYLADQNTTKMLAANTATLKAQQDANESLKAEQAMRQAAYDKATADTARISAQADALSAQHIDTGRWYASRSTGQRVLNLIGAIAGGVQSGIQGGPNRFLDDMYKSIDRDIDAQKSDIENGWKGVAAHRGIVAEEFARTGNLADAVATARTASLGNALSQIQTNMQLFDPQGTAAQSHVNAIMGVRAQMAQGLEAQRRVLFDEAVKAGTAGLAVQKQRADEVKQAADIQHGKDEIRQQGYATSVTARGQDFAHQDKLLEHAEKIAEIDQKSKEREDTKTDKAAEDWITKGVNDPRTGKPFINAAGKPLIDQADKLEYAAKHEKNADAAATLATHADALRIKAKLLYGLKSGQANDVKDKLAAAQNFVDTSRDLIDGIEADPGITNRAAFQALTTKHEIAKAEYILSIGAKPGAKEMQAFDEVLGPDPSKIVAWAKEGKLKAAMNSAIETVVDSAGNMLRTQGLETRPGEAAWTPAPRRDKTPELTGATSVERGKDAEPGLATKAGYTAFHPFSASEDLAADQRKAENDGDLTATGLSKEDDGHVRDLVTQYARAPESLIGDSQKAKSVATLSAFASNTKRPELATAVMTLLRGENPELYKTVLATLPQEQRDALEPPTAKLKAGR